MTHYRLTETSPIEYHDPLVRRSPHTRMVGVSQTPHCPRSYSGMYSDGMHRVHRYGLRRPCRLCGPLIRHPMVRHVF